MRFSLFEDCSDDQPPFVWIETAHAGLVVSDPEDVAIYQNQLELLRGSHPSVRPGAHK